eukprot:3754350-Alexandrium_andersonii.AAC.1
MDRSPVTTPCIDSPRAATKCRMLCRAPMRVSTRCSTGPLRPPTKSTTHGRSCPTPVSVQNHPPNNPQPYLSLAGEA